VSKKQLISFQIDSDKVNALDALSKVMNQDRAYLLNEAVAAYLDLQQWQLERIKASIKQADEGLLIDHREIKKLISN
jgi:predicted transcriptional regulator